MIIKSRGIAFIQKKNLLYISETILCCNFILNKYIVRNKFYFTENVYNTGMAGFRIPDAIPENGQAFPDRFRFG